MKRKNGWRLDYFLIGLVFALSIPRYGYAQGGGTLRINTPSPLPRAIVGVTYGPVTIDGQGGTTPYTWTVTGLPAGMSFSIVSNDVRISGTPTAGALGSHLVAVTLDDSTSTPAVRASFQLEVFAPLSVSTMTLPPAVVGVPYSHTLTATGGKAPYAWAFAGSSPSWLSLSASGILSGTPTSAARVSFTVRVMDAAPSSQTDTAPLSITPASALSITSSSPLPGGLVNVAYSPQTLAAAGGTAPYTWSILTGSVPSGLTLSPGGVISGTPTSAGSSTASIQVADAGGQTASKSFTVTVAPALPTLSLSGLPATVNAAQQLPMGMSALPAPSSAMTGTLTMTFVPSTAVGGDDAAVRFSTGSRTTTFTISPNTVNAVFPANLLLLTGTVAGNIVITANIQNGPSGVRVGTITVQPIVPQLTAITATRSAGAIRIQMTGYSPERRVIVAEFSFAVTTPWGVTTRVDLLRDVEAEFDAWYRSAASVPFGSSFLLDQTFVVQGDATMVQSVTIRLTNSQGGSASVSSLIN